MKTKITYLAALMTFFSLINTEFSFSQCEGNQVELDAIKLKYESKYKDVEKKAEDIKDDAPSPNIAEQSIQTDFVVEMKEQHFALDLVSITMKDKKISFGIPQITMEMKSIKFDEVYTKMVLKKTGQYPQIHCKDTWIHLPFGGKTKGVPKCTTIWKDILTEVPEVHTRTVEIKTNLPKFKMAITEFITAIPEFKMVRQDIKMNLPSITIKNVKAETKQMEKETEELKNYSQDLIGEQKKDFATAISGNFQCQRNNLLIKRDELTNSFLNSIKEIDLNIEQLNTNGFDPSNLKSSDGQTVNLLELKRQLVDKEKEALISIDNAINELNVTEKKTLNEYLAV
ncbi:MULTISPECIES: hypothetical protein [Flavobacterium]|uniref:Uncharacterized protein n=1 Tax=Flavobacterium salmonis TaxID=2654844 RepID=A0A6V6YWW4_9FLAO|nr:MULTISPECIES: hypothetical protein [Flavobacterium]OOV19395.1 hypothetical protein BXU10_06955 [Flavobacterium sp. LM4]CAD0003734.1 hypothetical protein FLAT13_01827 [Flavobacterium salmonis]